MPVTTLDPRTALIVIDLQKGIAALPTVHLMQYVVHHSAALAEAFRARGLPVVLVNVAGGAPGRTEQPPRTGDFPPDWTELLPELNRQPQDHLLTKRTWGAFTGTGLEDWLRSQGVTQVVVCGVATSIGVEFDRAPGPRGRLQRHPRRRRHDRPQRRRAREQPRPHLPAARRDRTDRRDPRARCGQSGGQPGVRSPANASSGAFRSLAGFNYRIWAGGALVSNVGTWMQRTAQDWLVLTELTHRNATAVGVVMALQFGPALVLLPLTGWAADRLDRRKLLFATQAAMGALALGLGLLTVLHVVQLWHVYVFAFLLGCVTAFDSPARQTFVSELVGEGDLANAVALNSTSFNAARTIGPAVAGVLIGLSGSGPVFLINGASFGAVLVSLAFLRTAELHRRERPPRRQGALVEGFRYVWKRPDLTATLLMLFVIGTFGLNFPIFISTMTVSAFHLGASRYGLLTSVMAVGSVIGALLAARRARPHLPLLIVAATGFGLGCALAAIAPNYALFGLMLAAIGVCSQTFTTSSNGLVQISTDPEMRGRVMAIFIAVLMGGTPLGAPIVGWVADRFGPRWALGLGAAAGFTAALIGLRRLTRDRAAAAAVAEPVQ